MLLSSRCEIKTFSITNAGKTQTRIVDGKETYDNLTVLYQLPKKKNAYWTFDVTVDNATAQINAGDVLMMYAKLTNGENVAVPLALVSQGDEGSRYVGEYVDQEYLALLEENEGEGFSPRNCSSRRISSFPKATALAISSFPTRQTLMKITKSARKAH